MAVGIAAISEVYELEDTRAGMEATRREWDESNCSRRSSCGRHEKTNGGGR